MTMDVVKNAAITVAKPPKESLVRHSRGSGEENSPRSFHSAHFGDQLQEQLGLGRPRRKPRLKAAAAPPPLPVFIHRLRGLTRAIEKQKVHAAAARRLFAKVQAFDRGADGFFGVEETMVYLQRVGVWGTEAAYSTGRWAEAFPAVRARGRLSGSSVFL